MAQLYDEDILLDALVNVRAQKPLEERGILRQSAYPRKFVLEVAPDVVRLETKLLFARQQDLFL